MDGHIATRCHMFVLQSAGPRALPRRGVHCYVHGDNWEESVSSANLYWSIRRDNSSNPDSMSKLSVSMNELIDTTLDG